MVFENNPIINDLAVTLHGRVFQIYNCINYSSQTFNTHISALRTKENMICKIGSYQFNCENECSKYVTDYYLQL